MVELGRKNKVSDEGIEGTYLCRRYLNHAPRGSWGNQPLNGILVWVSYS